MTPVLRKVYTKKGSNSLIFNLPLDFANKLGIMKGDYLTVTKTDNSIIITKTKFSEEITKKGDDFNVK